MGQVTLERDVFIWGLGSLPAYAKSACVPVCLYNGRKIARNIHSFTLYLPLLGMYRMRYFARTDMHGHGPSSHHENEENRDAKIRLPLRPFLLRSLYPSPPSRHGVSALTHIRPSPVPKSVILFRFKPCRLLI